MSDKVIIDKRYKPVLVIQINRAKVRNAVDGETARLLHDAFIAFAEDDELSVAILRGSGGNFCAGADLRAISNDKAGAGLEMAATSNLLNDDMDEPGPMGPTRLSLPKPVIACIEGYAVAGGLELAAWSDLRVASKDARLGVLCRLRGVPLIDGGTYRLPKLIGLSRAQDLMLTGRLIDAYEGERMGLINVVADSSKDAFEASLELADTLCRHPQQCMRGDRSSALSFAVDHGCSDSVGKWNIKGEERRAMQLEFEHGRKSLAYLGQALEDFVNKKSSKL